jgi:parallel beta-helix repeat protein
MNTTGIKQFLLLCLLGTNAFATTYYVSTSGSNSNAGTAAGNGAWRTLQYAADNISAGDTVIVEPGTYVGFYMELNSGTESERIAFSAQDGVIINDDNPAGYSDDGIYLYDCDYVTVEGFEIQGGNGSNIARDGIRVVGASAAATIDGVIIRDNTINGCDDRGILTGYADDILIENNEVSNSVKEHGIYVSNSGDNPIIRGNTTWGNNACGIQLNADLGAGGDGIISNALVENNTIYDNGSGGGAAINLDGVQDSTIQNNLLYDNHSTGIALWKGDGATGCINNDIINNTVVNANDSRWALSITVGSTDNTVFNNILYTYYPSFRGSFVISSDSLSGLASDYNIVMDRFSADGGLTGLTLSSWQSTTGQDANSFIAVPSELFNNPALDDYSLFEDSLAINEGVAMFNSTSAPENDILGFSRSTVDIGAYEFDGIPIPEPSTMGILIIALYQAVPSRR